MTTESGLSLPLLSAGVVASVVALGVPVCAAGVALVASTPSTGRGRRRRAAVVSSSSDSSETDETSDSSSTSESDTDTDTETESNTRTSRPRGSATTDSCLPSQCNLMACHKQLLKHCSEQNRAFMACKAQHTDPRACAHLSEAVMKCTQDVLNESHAVCGTTLDAFAQCLESNGYVLENCRSQQRDFEGCLKVRGL